MQVLWGQKWMVLPHQDSTAVLHGALHDDQIEFSLQISELHGDSVASPAVAGIPDEVAALLAEFALVFSAPDSLPPKRSCDHSIPLVVGARPINVRPYRYPPSLKDEIEKQVADMIKLGIVRPSTSSFCSPVLLVRKKDGSYRFCVDYRYLSALTIKSKFPIPLFDQLMDELSKARWFSTLDFNLWLPPN